MRSRGITSLEGQRRGCPRNCKRQSLSPRCHWETGKAVTGGSLTGISQAGPTASQETCHLLDVFVNISDGVCR